MEKKIILFLYLVETLISIFTVKYGRELSGQGVCHACGRAEVKTQFFWGKTEGKNTVKTKL